MPLARDNPVLIIGAGRSGTNLLAQALAQDPLFCNVDENRYVWNYGQRSLKYDVRTASEAHGQTANYIRNYFHSVARREQSVVVDKTPSNVFRVPFVHALFPQAKVIHIIRDGRDNVLSRQYERVGGRKAHAHLQQARGLRFRAALIKKRMGEFLTLFRGGNIPPGRLPVVVRDKAGDFMRAVFTASAVHYGERAPGMHDYVRAYGGLQASAWQWSQCVMHGACAGRLLPSSIYLEIRYEDMLHDPGGTWHQLAAHLGIDTASPIGNYLVDQVRPDNTGKWRTRLSHEELRALQPHMRPALEFLGYQWE
ncbi:MAG: sulfotransferase [Gammaproteobacteria bacterium]|nr:sulfotransferase [Gammaproteobacteria bacterium]